VFAGKAVRRAKAIIRGVARWASPPFGATVAPSAPRVVRPKLIIQQHDADLGVQTHDAGLTVPHVGGLTVQTNQADLVTDGHDFDLEPEGGS
jgi:hypothetical protein